MTLQILHYEFLGPIKLSEWGPPMDEVLYLMLKRKNDTYEIIYAGSSEKTQNLDFFTKNEKFKCWVQNAGAEQNLYLSIYPMWDSEADERKRLLSKIIARYRPACNDEQ
jgi:hypothetical protein